MTKDGQQVFDEFQGNAAVMAEAIAKLRKATSDLIENSQVSLNTSTQASGWLLVLESAAKPICPVCSNLPTAAVHKNCILR